MRFDWLRGSVPEQTLPAGFWVASRTQPQISDIPSWNDWNGRIGAAYDLTGDGRTAVKGFAGRYVSNEGLGIVDQFSPIGFDFDFRSWNDAPFPLFGLPPWQRRRAADQRRRDTPIQRGRSLVQPELRHASRHEPARSRCATAAATGSTAEESSTSSNDEWTVSGMWHHRRYGNFRWFDNTALAASDFTSVDPPGTKRPESAGAVPASR